MSKVSRSALIVTGLVLLGRSPLLAQSATPSSPPLPPADLALTRTFADGHMAYQLTSTRPNRAWFANAPRIQGWQPAEGPAPYAVQISHVREDDAIKVDVEVLYNPGLTARPVASHLVTRGSRVVVEALRDFGYEPIALSTVEVVPLAPYHPMTFCITPEIEISGIELLRAPYPGYRVTLRNLSPVAVATFAVQSYRGSEEALSSVPRGAGGRPALEPGGTFTFTLNLSAGSAADLRADGRVEPRALDSIEIESVRWADGRTSGQERYPGMSLVIPRNEGRLAQLRRIVKIYEDILTEPADPLAALAAVRRKLDALPAFDPEQLESAQQSMTMTKSAALSDLRRYEIAAGSQDPAIVSQWLAAALERYRRLLGGSGQR